MVHTLQLKYNLAPQDIIYIEKRMGEFKHTDILFKETGLKATIYFRRQYPYETVLKHIYPLLEHPFPYKVFYPLLELFTFPEIYAILYPTRSSRSFKRI
ncbi:hypothetical protein SAMN02745151_00208 [[Clostridium] propionicum DSM 1682]|uniref:Uncharacterized protein n=1 Tax=Anaerotignum propionicum DSM 1682 TaxID=991789 RepID=A0A0X8V9A5_ANAPI|nr:hypothetical protein CPRO_01450 [Anaerotignum propionicum DSM 1682]SHE28804.1 hypothetical protein SAMN02745151_00208 [[Clostridium] propionicum DSM 1682] [Anaerotignum propionicum DSM 1682]